MTTSNTREKGIYKVTIVGSITNLGLLLFKFLAGIIGHSTAMIADAVHSLSDFVTDVIVVIFVCMANKPQDKNHNYGHGKFETLATLLIGLILFGVGFGIAYNGANDIVSVFKGAILPSPGILAFWAAIVSVISKEILFWYTIVKGKKLNSDTVVANAQHHRSDAFSSFGTAFGIGGAIFLGPKWTVLDPLAALIVSFFIIRTAFKLMKPALDELMEKSLPESVESEIKNLISKENDVSDLHNLRTRKIGNQYAIEFHLRVDGETSLKRTHEIISNIEDKLKMQFGENTHVIIHMEPTQEEFEKEREK